MRPIIVILTALAFFLGYMAHLSVAEPKPVKLQNLPFCLHSEYQSMKELRAEKPPLDQAMVEPGHPVRLWVRCE
jgi:hypothetical protein